MTMAATKGSSLVIRQKRSVWVRCPAAKARRARAIGKYVAEMRVAAAAHDDLAAAARAHKQTARPQAGPPVIAGAA